MLDASEKQRAIGLIREGADVLARSEKSVLVPDYVRIGKYGVEYIETVAGPYCEEKDIAGLIRYLADMMED